MLTLLQDTRFAVRQLWNRPAFTLLAVLTLAIGVGVNTIAFGVVNGLLIKGLAPRTADGVARIVTLPGDDEGGNASVPSTSGLRPPRAARSMSRRKDARRLRGGMTASPKRPGCCSCPPTISRW